MECFAHHVIHALVGERLSHLMEDHVLQLDVGPSGRLQEAVLSPG